ncbi:hypothetical protein [Arthrobacter monumenti]
MNTPNYFNCGGSEKDLQLPNAMLIGPPQAVKFEIITGEDAHLVSAILRGHGNYAFAVESQR